MTDLTEADREFAQLLYDELEGPIANQDASRQMRQWETCLRLVPAARSARDAEREPELAALQAKLEAAERERDRMRDALVVADNAMRWGTVFITSREQAKKPEGHALWREDHAKIRAALRGDGNNTPTPAAAAPHTRQFWQQQHDATWGEPKDLEDG